MDQALKSSLTFGYSSKSSQNVCFADCVLHQLEPFASAGDASPVAGASFPASPGPTSRIPGPVAASLATVNAEPPHDARVSPPRTTPSAPAAATR